MVVGGVWCGVREGSLDAGGRDAVDQGAPLDVRATAREPSRLSRGWSIAWQGPNMTAPVPGRSGRNGSRVAMSLDRADDDGAAPELMSVTRAARWLGLSRSTLYEALARHRIAVTPIDIGGQMRLSRRQLERWLEGPPVEDEPAPEPAASTIPLPRASSVYDEVFRDLAPAAGPRRSPTRSAEARSSSASACA